MKRAHLGPYSQAEGRQRCMNPVDLTLLLLLSPFRSVLSMSESLPLRSDHSSSHSQEEDGEIIESQPMPRSAKIDVRKSDTQSTRELNIEARFTSLTLTCSLLALCLLVRAVPAIRSA